MSSASRRCLSVSPPASSSAPLCLPHLQLFLTTLYELILHLHAEIYSKSSPVRSSQYVYNRPAFSRPVITSYSHSLGLSTPVLSGIAPSSECSRQLAGCFSAMVARHWHACTWVAHRISGQHRAPAAGVLLHSQPSALVASPESAQSLPGSRFVHSTSAAAPRTPLLPLHFPDVFAFSSHPSSGTRPLRCHFALEFLCRRSTGSLLAA
jgi:hypothetical protein